MRARSTAQARSTAGPVPAHPAASNSQPNNGEVVGGAHHACPVAHVGGVRGPCHSSSHPRMAFALAICAQLATARFWASS